MTDDGYTKRRRACLHEAGHALASRSVGLEVHEIVVDDRHGGLVQHGLPAVVTGDDPEACRLLEDQVFVSLAGEFAETGYVDPDRGSGSDRRKADEIVRLLPGDRFATLRRLEERTAAFVDEHIHAIRLLAGSIHDHGGRLAGPDLDDALEMALGHSGSRNASSKERKMDEFPTTRRLWFEALCEQAGPDLDDEQRQSLWADAEQRARSDEPAPTPGWLRDRVVVGSTRSREIPVQHVPTRRGEPAGEVRYGPAMEIR